VGICGHGNEPLVSIKCGKFFDETRSCWYLKDCSVELIGFLVGWLID
jgi:hypothetical protein